MSALMFAIVFAAAAPASADPGIGMAQRLTAAIKRGAPFQESDFARPLGATDEAALRRFAPCKVELIDHTLLPDPEEKDTYVHNPDSVLVTFACRGVPADKAAGISLHLKDGKIATIETHNADLVKAQ
jgi:hypothetical protein